MLDEHVARAVGTPNDGVSHWGISREEKGELRRLDFPDERGVRVKEWPLDELTIENLRARWASGKFKVHWFTLTPEDPDPKRRRVAQGHGPTFEIEPEPTPAPIPAPVAPVLPSSGDNMSAALQFATLLMQMSDQRSQATMRAVTELAGMRAPGAPSPDAGLRDIVAELRAEVAAERTRREMDERHRAEMVEVERRLQRAERRAEEAEREREGAPVFEPGAGSFMEQLGYGLLNAAAKLRPETLEKLAAVATPIIERISSGGAVAAPPAPPPPVARPLPARAAPPPPPEPAGAQSMMPQSPIATTATGIPVVRANGAAPAAKVVTAPGPPSDAAPV